MREQNNESTEANNDNNEFVFPPELQEVMNNIMDEMLAQADENEGKIEAISQLGRIIEGLTIAVEIHAKLVKAFVES